MADTRPPIIFSGETSRPLAEAICKELGVKLSENNLKTFADGEIYVWLENTVRGRDCFIIQSTCNPVNDSLMALLINIDTLRRASAGRITAVIPYFGYARQDRKDRGRSPITAKLVANMITAAGADRVMVVDLHAAQEQGFFDIPVDHLTGLPLFVDYYREKFGICDTNRNDFVAVSPDVGSVARTRAFAERLGIGLAIVDKRRPSANVSEVMHVIGDVEGKNCIMLDDMVDTAGSLCKGSEALKENGAVCIYAAATHGVLSANDDSLATDKIEKSRILELVVLDTIPLPAYYRGKTIKQLSIAPMLAAAITHIHEETSVSEQIFGAK